MITNERKLADAAMTQQLWADATTRLFNDDWEMIDQVEFYGRGLLLAFRNGELSHNQLKRMAKEANWLEREAIECSGGDIDNLGDADYIEATGRRLAHHALKYALEVRAGHRSY